MGAQIKCNKCKEIIESKHVHDFRQCKCGAIFIDGGNDYTRIGGNREDWDYVKESDEDKEWQKWLDGLEKYKRDTSLFS